MAVQKVRARLFAIINFMQPFNTFRGGKAMSEESAQVL